MPLEVSAQPGLPSHLLLWPLPPPKPEANPPHHSRLVSSCSVDGPTELPMVNRFGGKIKFVITSGCFGSSFEAAASSASCCPGLAWTHQHPTVWQGKARLRSPTVAKKPGSRVYSGPWCSQNVASPLGSPFLFYSLTHGGPRLGCCSV